MSDSSPSRPAVRALAIDLAARARETDQRRLLVLSGDRDAGWDAAFSAVEGVGADDDAVTFVSTREGVRFDRVSPARADSLLGTTRSLVVCDAHEGFSPNLLGRLSGVVDGGGLLVLLTPPLDAWPTVRTGFDESLAVPPFPVGAVTGRFRRRLGQIADHLMVNLPLIHTPKGALHTGPDCKVPILGHLDHIPGFFKGLVPGHPGIFLGMSGAGGYGYLDALNTCPQGPIEPCAIEHQGRVLHVRETGKGRKQLFGIGHLGHPTRMDE